MAQIAERCPARMVSLSRGVTAGRPGIEVLNTGTPMSATERV
jgi:hypothetical protein